MNPMQTKPEGLIDINDYSLKYGISTSTLRRRIRANQITYKLHKGRYFVPDSPDLMASVPLFFRQGPVKCVSVTKAELWPIIAVAAEEYAREHPDASPASAFAEGARCFSGRS